MSLKTRLERVEAKRLGQMIRWHRIYRDQGTSEQAAIDAYGRDRITPGDSLILRTIV